MAQEHLSLQIRLLSNSRLILSSLQLRCNSLQTEHLGQNIVKRAVILLYESKYLHKCGSYRYLRRHSDKTYGDEQALNPFSMAGRNSRHANGSQVVMGAYSKGHIDLWDLKETMSVS